MSLWRIARDEVAGAWRSVRYDLRRRCAADRRRTDADDADTGIHPFDSAPHDTHDDVDRSPQRLIAASAFGLVAVIGAAGSYFAVVNGLGTLLTESSRPGALPVAAEAGPAPVATGRQTPTARLGHNSRLGHGRSIAATPPPRAPQRTKVPRTPRTTPRTTPPATAPSIPRATRTPGTPQSPCRCTPPTVPPTVPSGPPASGGASPSINGSSSPSASASPSPSPSTGDDPRERPDYRPAPRS